MSASVAGTSMDDGYNFISRGFNISSVNETSCWVDSTVPTISVSKSVSDLCHLLILNTVLTVSIPEAEPLKN